MSITLEQAKEKILEVLREKGRITNAAIKRLVEGDAALAEEASAELILEDLAEDKKGVGLILLGVPATAAPTSPQAHQAPQAAPVVAAKPAGPMGIFISYGRADAEALAFKLEADLTSQGHRVWLDKQQMKSGSSWEEQIEQAILGHDVLVALLSPHAVRRPDGVCLDEISMARYNGRPIIPLMVSLCRPPLGIYRLDWIDFQQWEGAAPYDRGLGRLSQALADPKGSVEGTHARLFASLRPFDSGARLDVLRRDFTGRHWLIRELDQWLATEPGRVFFITGDPGTGKSAVIAHLVHTRDVGAYHLCIFGLKETLSPFTFVRSIAAQLATQLPDYRAALDALDFAQIRQDDPGSYFHALVVAPLRAETTKTPVLIVVDGLDEAAADGSALPALLRDQLEYLPPFIRLVLSSRKESAILDMFSRYTPREIEASRAENLDDIRAYLARKLGESALRHRLAAAGADPAEVARQIEQRGEGNFLYATEVIKSLALGQLDPRDPASFPAGLVGIYQASFEREFPEGQGFAELRPLLEVLCAAREPLTVDLIADALQWDPFEVENRLDQVAPFFPERAETFAPYHKSVTDWLTGSAGKSRVFRINVCAGHRALAQLYDGWTRLDLTARRYALSSRVQHLLGAGQSDGATTALMDFGYLVRRIELIGGHSMLEILRDIGFVERQAPVTIGFQDWAGFLRGHAHQVARGGAVSLLQLAIADAEQSPVTAAAEHWLAEQSPAGSWLRCLNPPREVLRSACVLTVEGHTGKVLAVALHADGRRGISTTRRSTTRTRGSGSGKSPQADSFAASRVREMTRRSSGSGSHRMAGPRC